MIMRKLLLFLFICSTTSLVACNASFSNNSLQDTDTLAQSFGLLPEDNLATFQICTDSWPPFSLGNCSTIGIYSTQLSLEDFSQKIDLKSDSDFTQREIDGFSIFTYLNFHTEQTLTGNGKDGLGDARLTMEEPQALGWKSEDETSQALSLNFYALGNDTVDYQLDGKPLRDNLVVFILPKT